MKKFLLLLAFCGLAHSATIGTLANKAGGLIVITDVPAKSCKNAWIAYTSTSEGKTSYGCWFDDDTMVHVEWPDGSTYAYPVENFKFNYDVLKTFIDRRKRGVL